VEEELTLAVFRQKYGTGKKNRQFLVSLSPNLDTDIKEVGAVNKGNGQGRVLVELGLELLFSAMGLPNLGDDSADHRITSTALKLAVISRVGRYKCNLQQLVRNLRTMADVIESAI